MEAFKVGDVVALSLPNKFNSIWNTPAKNVQDLVRDLRWSNITVKLYFYLTFRRYSYLIQSLI